MEPDTTFAKGEQPERAIMVEIRKRRSVPAFQLRG
jgi:hypothetical protein